LSDINGRTRRIANRNHRRAGRAKRRFPHRSIAGHGTRLRLFVTATGYSNVIRFFAATITLPCAAAHDI
jgi:hypothetical protein